MSEHAHDNIPQVETIAPSKVAGLSRIFLSAGAAGLLLAFLIGFFAKVQFAYTYLFAFAFFFTVIMGAIFWNCLHHATDSEWSVVIRRQIENVASLYPYMALFFVPLIPFFSTLWKWWPMLDGADPLLDAKRPYLSHWFFILRLVLYFVVVSWVALKLRKLSTKQDNDGRGAHSYSMRKFGIAGIPAVALGITFAGFDWLMGLDYHWFSTMWGVYLFAGAAGSSMSLIVLILTALKKNGYLSVVTDEHYHIMGKFMLAFTIFWAYVGFSQYMLIWYANIPEENIYFIIRNQGTWWWLSTLLVVGRFFLPFPILLTQWVKRNPDNLKWVAIWIIGMQLLDVFVVVMPVLHKTGFGILDVLYALCPIVGIGGILAWAFLRKLTSANLFPTRDPRLALSINLHN